MKHMARISLAAIVAGALLFLLPFNRNVATLRLWGDIRWALPLWTLLVLSFAAGGAAALIIWLSGATAQAFERRGKGWETKGRKAARRFVSLAARELDKGRRKKAQNYLLKARKADERYAPIYGQMAKLRDMEGRHKEAYEELRKAVSLDPNDPELLERLAVCCLSRGAPDRAADALFSILDIEPDSCKALKLLSKALIEAGRWEEALSAQETLIKRLPQSEKDFGTERKLGTQAELARILPNRKQGVAILKNVLKGAPGFATAAIFLAQRQAEMGKVSKARSTLREAFETNPSAAIYERLARLEGEESFELAQSMAKKALDANSRLDGLRLGMARMLLKRGKAQEAVEQLDKASGAGKFQAHVAKAKALMETAPADETRELLRSIADDYEWGYLCAHCGHFQRDWGARCAECGRWNTLDAGVGR